ncbi:hypothetical protein Slin14017_G103970 [Septoria linicola]|nr:hypothetical protein Slin14017_G103970 [Septoria linicola]
MGVLNLRIRQATEDSNNEEGGGLDTHAQIAIGVIVPVIVLLGGLIYFIWRTERRRQNAKTETDKTHPSRLHEFLRRNDAMRGSRLIDSPKMEHIRPEMDHSHRHELGDASFMHELEDARSPIYEINKPLPSHPARKDSAINSPTELDHSQVTFPRAQTGLSEAPARPQRYSAAEMSAYNPIDMRQSTASSVYRHSTLGTIRHSAVSPPPPPSSGNGWRASLQPNSFLGGFANKRDRRVSKATSSRYSKQDFTMMEPHSTRHSRSHRGSEGDDEEEGKRSDDSAISPPVSAISEMDLSRQPSQNFGHNSQRVSAVPPDSPAWMKRMSVQDEVEQKWKDSGELVGPGDHKI